jgi:hypothetical protein
MANSQGLGIVQGWKAIGRYIGRSERTARRWADNYHLPIRRAITKRPFAFICELDNYMVYLSDGLINKCPKERERQREHAAMMRRAKESRQNRPAPNATFS